MPCTIYRAICHDGVKRQFRKIDNTQMEAIYIVYLKALLNTDELIQLQTKLGLYCIRLLRIYLNYSCSCFRNRRQLLRLESLLLEYVAKASGIELERDREREREKGRCKKNNWELNIQQQMR